MQSRLAVVVNKNSNELSPSETFLHAHINELPHSSYSLIGNPGYRIIREGSVGPGKFLASRSLIPLGFRWLERRALGSSVADQDTTAMSRWLKAESIDVVLAEYGPTAVSVMNACNQTQTPLVVHFHGFDAYTDYVLTTFGEAYRKLFDISSAVVGVSSHMCDQLIRLGAAPNKVYLNPCGAMVTSSKSEAVNDPGYRFAMIGRLVEKKAPFVSLMAFARLCESVPEATLEIVGDGPLKAACIQMVHALGLNERVTLHGAQSHEFALGVLARSDYFIQHSVKAPNGDMEGTPVGVLEAMGAGLPVISTRHGGIRDIIAEGDTGILVDEYDVSGMVEGMQTLCRDSGLSAEMGRKARASVMARWTLEKSISGLSQIIKSVTD